MLSLSICLRNGIRKKRTIKNCPPMDKSNGRVSERKITIRLVTRTILVEFLQNDSLNSLLPLNFLLSVVRKRLIISLLTKSSLKRLLLIMEKNLLCINTLNENSIQVFTSLILMPLYEKGLVENTNKLIRQYFPKSLSFKTISHQQVVEVMTLLNNRPRKTLQFNTTNEIFFANFIPNKKIALGGRICCFD